MKKKAVWKTVRDALLLIFGTAVFAFGFDLFLLPHQINVGGVSGLAMLLHKLIGKGTVGLFTAAINVPLFLMGFQKLGKRFFFGSLAGVLLSSVFLDLFLIIPVPAADTLLASLYGGILIGLGLGMVFLAGASTGGTDIVARLLKKRMREIPIGKLVMAADVLVILLTGVVYRDFSRVLYSAVPAYVSSLAMDSLLYGLDYSAVAMIISDRPVEVTKAIEEKLERGVTQLAGKGGYTGRDKLVLMSAVKRRQISELKKLVEEIDPNAFVILQEAHQVLGEGFRRYNEEL